MFISIAIFVVVSCACSLLYFFVYLEPSKTIVGVDYVKITMLGAVRKPGTYLVPPMKKLYEVVDLADGFEDYALLDLIELQEIVRPDSTYTIKIDEKRIEKINLNAIYSFTILKNALKSYVLPESVAKSIVENKKLFGNYKSWKDIRTIKGVGEKTIENLKKFFFLL